MIKLPLYPELPLAAVEQVQPLAADSACQRCELGAKARTVCMRPEVSRSKVQDPEGDLLLVVGEQPTAADDSAGRPLTGNPGALLRGVISKHWRGPVALELAVRCAPRAAEVKPKHVAACRPYLARTLELTRPRRVVAIGSKAAFGLLGRAVPVLSSRRGYGWLYNDGDAVPVFFVLSPGQALRNRFLKSWFEEDLEWALTCEIPKQPPWEQSCLVIETVGDSKRAVAALRSASWAAYDVETQGRMFGADQSAPPFEVISLAACARGSDVGYVWEGAALRDPAVRGPMLEWLADPTAGKTGSNGKYDGLAVREGFGVVVRGYVGDMRLWRRLLQSDADGKLAKMAELIGLGGHKEEVEEAIKANERALRSALTKYRKGPEVYTKWTAGRLTAEDFEGALGDALATTLGQLKGTRRLTLVDDLPADGAYRGALPPLLPGMPTRLDAWLKAGGDPKPYRYGLLPKSTLRRYNARDAVCTAGLGVVLGDALDADKRLRRVWDVETQPANAALEQVEAWGIGVDAGAAAVLQQYLAGEEARLAAILKRYGGDVNFNSPIQIRKLLFETLRLPKQKLTDTGQDSTDASVLEALAGKHPLPGAILEHRTIEKMKGTYADGVLRAIRADGRICTNFKLDGTGTGRISSEDPNCFDGETEVLTTEGWVRFDALIDGSAGGCRPTKDWRVAQWRDGRVEFVQPTMYIAYQHAGKLTQLSNQHVDLKVTDDHRCLVRSRQTGKLRVTRADVYPEDHQQIHAGIYDSGSGALQLSDAEITLLCATQADGSWHDAGIDFSFCKRRKVARLLAALDTLGAPYSVNYASKMRDKTRTRIYVKGSAVVDRTRALLGGEKLFGRWLLDLPRAALDTFCEEVFKWDGCITRMNHYASALKNNADWVQIALVLSGKRANTRVYVPSEQAYGVKLSHQVDVTHRDYSMTTNIERTRPMHNASVYCLSVPSDFILVRRNGKVCVTGQCQNIPRAADSAIGKMIRDCFVAAPGCVLIEADYSQLELRIAAVLSGDPKMRAIFEAGIDYHQRTAEMVARKVWGIDPSQVQPMHRTKAKTLNFALLYGAGDYAIAKGMGSTEDEARALREAVFGEFRQLAAWIRECVAEGRRTGEAWTWWDGERARRRSLWRIADEDEGARETAERGTFNTAVQGTASSYCVRSVTQVVEWILAEQVPAKLVLTVHDSILLEVQESALEEVVYTTKSIMQSHNSLGVPLDVDIKVGPRWGSMEKFVSRYAA